MGAHMLLDDLALDALTLEGLPSLLDLPPDALTCVLAHTSLASLGRAASTCTALSTITDSHGPWQQLCLRQGLEAKSSPKAVLRRATLCGHERAQTSSEFDWRGDGTCKCVTCGRLYRVVMTPGFIDSSKGSTKLVTRAEFHAMHEAPRRLQMWGVTWDRRAGAAAKAAAAGQARLAEPTDVTDESPCLGPFKNSWEGVTSFLGEKYSQYYQCDDNW